MSKRANGEGTVRQREGGRWEARLVYTDPNTGQTKRASFYGSKASEARAKMRAAGLRLESGAPVRDAKRTVAEWLGHWQRTTLAASSRKETTKVLYRHLISGHIAPAPFGAIPLDRLKPSDVDGLILAMRSKTKPAPGGITIRALSDATVQRVFTVLRVALDGAVRDGLLARNPAAAVRQPAVPRREARFLSSADVVALLRAAEGSRYQAPLVLIAATGLRKGEALALQWADVDFASKSLRVRGTLARVDGALMVSEPKTAKSRRSLPLSEGVVAMLRAHRKTQVAERLHAGNVWTDTGHVFTSESGQPLDPRNVLRALTVAARKAGIQGVTVHTLRHSAATAMLEAGIHLKAVSELLGHADIRVTADVYGHTSDEVARAAMDRLAASVGVAVGVSPWS